MNFQTSILLLEESLIRGDILSHIESLAKKERRRDAKVKIKDTNALQAMNE